MKDKEAIYLEKFDALKGRTLYGDLDSSSREFLRKTAFRYRLTFQELRRLAEIGRDLEMWRESPLERWWSGIEDLVPATITGRQRKKLLLKELDRKIDEVRSRPTSYPVDGLPPPARAPLKLVAESSEKTILGDCPVASEKTVCCNLKTIDAVENCAFGCSYCTIQTFYGDRVVVDGELRRKLNDIRLDPDRFHHIGTGQSSDSLVWGNKNGLLDDLCRFAARNSNVLLELKTKAANVSYFMKNPTPPNVVCSWSLNTETIITSEEHFTANLADRLAAARKVADRGVKVAFHFHPIVHHEGWDEEYPALARRVLESFRPEEVLFISFGSLTFIKPVIKQIRRRGEASKILQMDMVPDPHGKLTYPDPVKIRLFRTMYGAFEPWHEEVFFYLCMERAYFWEQVFGRCYATNEEFEADLAGSAMAKIEPLSVPARSEPV